MVKETTKLYRSSFFEGFSFEVEREYNIRKLRKLVGKLKYKK